MCSHSGTSTARHSYHDMDGLSRRSIYGPDACGLLVLQEALADEAQRGRPSLLRAAHATFGREYYYLGAMQVSPPHAHQYVNLHLTVILPGGLCFAWQLVTDLLAFSGPVLLKLIVTFVQDHPTGEEGVRRGLLLLAAMVSSLLAY